MERKNNNLLQYIPPVFIKLKKTFSKYGWKGNYKNWAEAKAKTSGYDGAVILEKCKNAQKLVIRGDVAFERDSVTFSKMEYNWQLVSLLLYCTSKQNGKLNVLDFGGSLGSTYYQYKHLFSGLNECLWSIVEQSNFVNCGKEDFQNEILKFYNNTKECIDDRNPDILLISNCLQYIENAEELLTELLSFNFQYIILDLIALSKLNKDIITVQKVNPIIYNASYPCQFFDEKKIINIFEHKYKIVFDYNYDNITYNDNLFYKGFLFEKNKKIYV